MSTRDDVLRMLEENRDSYLSGSRMAQFLGVTRASVWKAVKAIEEDGYKIEAVTNKGYRLASDNQKLSEYAVRRHLKTRELGKILYVLESVDSTNNYAKTLAAEGAPHGTAVIAQTQTGGRGRLGRSFFSPPGAGMYLSVILRPAVGTNRALSVTSAAAVAVCRAVEKFIDEDAQIKWVNDVYIAGKKVCGILTEAVSDLESGSVEFLVVGIGINLTCEAFPPELREIATALSEHSKKKVELAELIAAVLYELEQVYQQLDTAAFMPEYRQRSCVVGKWVKAIRAGTEHEVFIKDIDDTGALIAENRVGEPERINSGEISLRFL